MKKTIDVVQQHLSVTEWYAVARNNFVSSWLCSRTTSSLDGDITGVCVVRLGCFGNFVTLARSLFLLRTDEKYRLLLWLLNQHTWQFKSGKGLFPCVVSETCSTVSRWRAALCDRLHANGGFLVLTVNICLGMKRHVQKNITVPPEFPSSSGLPVSSSICVFSVETLSGGLLGLMPTQNDNHLPHVCAALYMSWWDRNNAIWWNGSQWRAHVVHGTLLWFRTSRG